MRLIDADEILLNDESEYTKTMLEVDDTVKTIITAVHNNIQTLIQEAPTIDALPVKHGHWIEKRKKTFFEGLYEVSYTCNLCGDVVYGKYNYCSNCGAKMDGGE